MAWLVHRDEGGLDREGRQLSALSCAPRRLCFGVPGGGRRGMHRRWMCKDQTGFTGSTGHGGNGQVQPRRAEAPANGRYRRSISMNFVLQGGGKAQAGTSKSWASATDAKVRDPESANWPLELLPFPPGHGGIALRPLLVISRCSTPCRPWTAQD